MDENVEQNSTIYKKKLIQNCGTRATVFVSALDAMSYHSQCLIIFLLAWHSDCFYGGMNNAYQIVFNFVLDGLSREIPMEAIVEPRDNYFLVHGFFISGGKSKASGQNAILPPQEIMEVKKNDRISWVHRDSEKETELSKAIGRGIIDARNKIHQSEKHR